MINLDNAFEIARKEFIEYFKNRIIPNETVRRLSRSAGLENNEWLINISLLPNEGQSEGLKNDLEHQGKLMVTIRVNRVTGNCTLTEEPFIEW